MFDYARDFLLRTTGTNSALRLPQRGQHPPVELGRTCRTTSRSTKSSRLTLACATEFATPIYEANQPDVELRSLRAVHEAGQLQRRYTINPNTKDFGPRLGAAYSFDRATVLRAARHQLCALEPHRLKLPHPEPAQRHRGDAAGLSQPAHLSQHPERLSTSPSLIDPKLYNPPRLSPSTCPPTRPKRAGA